MSEERVNDMSGVEEVKSILEVEGGSGDNVDPELQPAKLLERAKKIAKETEFLDNKEEYLTLWSNNLDREEKELESIIKLLAQLKLGKLQVLEKQEEEKNG